MKCYGRHVTCKQCDVAADCEIRKAYLELKREIRKIKEKLRRGEI